MISQNVSYGKSKTQKAEELGWDCFKEKEAQQAMNNIAKLDEELGLFGLDTTSI